MLALAEGEALAAAVPVPAPVPVREAVADPPLGLPVGLPEGACCVGVTRGEVPTVAVAGRLGRAEAVAERVAAVGGEGVDARRGVEE